MRTSRRTARLATAASRRPSATCRWCGPAARMRCRPGQVLKKDGEPFKVFTPFYRAWSERGWHSPSTSNPARVSWHPVDGIDVPHDPRTAAELPEAGEAARASGVEGVPGRGRRALQRGAQPARPRQHVAHVGAPEVRGDPPAHHARRPRAARTGIPTSAVLARLLRAGPAPLAGQRARVLPAGHGADALRHRGSGPRSGSRPGSRAGPATRSSTPVCVSCSRPAGCTTASG